MISLTTQYALRAVVFLAEHPGRNTTDSIAKATQIPAGYLAKVMQSLSRAGVVVGQRGLNGGFSLSAPADKTTVLSVIEAVEPIPRIRACPLNLPEHRHALCALHHKLDHALSLVEESFRGTTVDELTTKRTFPFEP